jgi:Mrp family chromosome partitioning ATPase
MMPTRKTWTDPSERDEAQTTSELLRSEIQAALGKIQHPELKDRNLQDLGMIRGISVDESAARIHLALPRPQVPFQSQLEAIIRDAVHDISPEIQAHISFEEMSPRQRARFFAIARGLDPEGLKDQKVDKVLAVMSGKGGVGKSSVAALLACALQRRGLLVGILDADITGPSIPKLFGVQSAPSAGPDGIRPPRAATGVRLISINLLLSSEDQPVVWRGPLIGRAIEQFWNDISWGRLDYLIVDLPPGTADAALTVMQSLPLDGVVLVTSPQHLAGMVVRKAANMAKRLGVPLLGLIENMSHLICPECGARIEAFGPSQAQATASLVGIPLLGDIPLDPELTVKCDTGAIETYRSPSFELITAQIVQSQEEGTCVGSPA